MFVDPFGYTYNAVAQSLARVRTDGTSSTYRKSDGTHIVDISHTQTKSRIRSMIKLTLTKVAPDPLQPATNVPYSVSCYTVFDQPITGFSIAENTLTLAAFASIIANAPYQAKFLGLEH